MDPILEQYKELEQQVLSYTPALDKTLLFKAFQFANCLLYTSRCV